MRSVAYQDSKGRWSLRSIPDDRPDEFAVHGMLVGPPEFDESVLNEEVSVRLTNELYHRGIHTYKQAVRSRDQIRAALMAALNIDVETILVAYKEL